MRLTRFTACLILYAATAFAQGDRGTITGTVTDPAGAVVANAAVQAKAEKAVDASAEGAVVSSIPEVRSSWRD